MTQDPTSPLKELANDHAMEALTTLIALLHDESSSLRFKAAVEILNRAIGRPALPTKKETDQKQNPQMDLKEIAHLIINPDLPPPP